MDTSRRNDDGGEAAAGPARAGLISDVGQGDFDDAVIAASRQRPVLVDFWAGWCAPCRMLTPVLEKVVADFAPQVLLAKVDVDAEVELAARYGVRSLPTVMLFRNGNIVEQFVGVQPERAVRAMLEAHLPRASDDERAAARRLFESGAVDAAAARLAAALEADPDNYALALELVAVYLAADNAADAQALLERLPANIQHEPAAQRLQAHAHFMRSASTVPTGDDDAGVTSRYALAARRLLGGETEPALEELLAILRSDPELGRRGLLHAFTLLGSDSALVERYRRRMAALLY